MADEILSNVENLTANLELNPSDFTILVADDNDVNILLMKTQLRMEKYNVVTETDSTKEYDICKSQHIDLVLQDVMMPKMDGYEVCKQLKSDPDTAHIPVIFLTAFFTKDDNLKGFAAGGNDFVGKPFDKEILMARISAHLKVALARRMINERNERLKNTLMSRDRMYSVIAHDLRSPLGVVQMTLKAIMDMTVDTMDPGLHGMLTECNDQVNDLFGLLDNLLKWTKSQAGAMKVVYQDFSASLLTHTMNDMFSPMVAQKGQTLLVAEVDDSVQLHSDVDMCQTILRNLISNAVKFTEEGKNIYVDMRTEGDFAVFDVRDEGRGMTQEQLGQLFNKDTHFTTFGTKNEEGSGLGLMLCKGFAEMLGGRIEVQSVPGVGSTFSLYIPLAQ